MKQNQKIRIVTGKQCSVPLMAALLALLLLSGFGNSAYAQNANAPNGQVSQATLVQIAAIAADKATRTPAQQKMDSQLIYAERANRNQAEVVGAPELQADVKVQNGNQVLVDITATVSVALLQEIVRVGGQVISSFPAYNAIRALLPLPAIETIAARPDVRFIQRAVEGEPDAAPQPAAAHRGKNSFETAQVKTAQVAKLQSVQRIAQRLGSSRGVSGFGADTGTVNSEGDGAHRANVARSTYGIDGTGVTIGVLSDGVGNLSASQASGNLPSNVTVLPGQAGAGFEGTAMLEIIHDLAPGARLIFATALNGIPSFASNIRALRAAGCDVIVDDVRYGNESPFQAGPIEQAVYDVANDGALYFSSAGNAGNKNDGTSSVWVGDFADGGAATSPPYAKAGNLHSFEGSTFNTITGVPTSAFINFHWSDPLGASDNDYDVYLVNSSGAVIRSSTTTQNGTQDPFEYISPYSLNNRVVIVKAIGAANRYLYLGTGRGRLAISTAMFQNGHNAAGADNAFSVAAVPAPNRPFNPTDVVETFSSDGPRRIFYRPNGTAITPGNFSSSGGEVIQKPDIAAADRVSTSVPTFTTFSGTSAAAPHAAAIAALLLSYNPGATPAQIRTALQSTAIDIEAPGTDRDAGFGLLDVPPAIAALSAPVPNLILDSSALSGGNNNGVIDPNECNLLNIALCNAIGNTGASATGVTATLSSDTAGVTVAQANSAYPNIAFADTQTNTTPFQISTDSGFICGAVVNLTLTVNTSNAGSFVIPLQFTTGTSGTATGFESSDVPKAIPDNNATGVDSSVTVSGITGPVGKVTVSLYITHTYDFDIQASLIAPDGTEIQLFQGIGGSGDNFGISSANRTVLDDDVATSLLDGSPPFVGTFNTNGALSAFRGRGANGTWKLRLKDLYSGDTGTLRNWAISVAPLACAEGGGACNLGAAPVLDLNGEATGTNFNASFTEGGGAIPIVDSAALTVSDADNANLAGATITLSNRPDGASETLAVTPSGAIIAANIAYSNGVLTITANAPLADYQAVLRSATYNNSSSNPDTTARTINFVVNDGAINSNTAISTVQVLAVNAAPVADDQSVNTNEDTPLNITLTASDADNDALTFSPVASPQHGTLSGTAPNLTYIPNPNFNGSDSFTFKANDGTADSNIATITLQVLAVNDVPVANAQTVSTDVDTAVNITLTASDADNDALTFTVESNPTHGTLSGTAPDLTYTPDANYTGLDSFTFKANDGTIDSNVATISLRVGITNTAPVANSQSVTTDEDTAKAIVLMASDAENDALTFSVVNNPAHGTLSGTAPNLTYTPNLNFNGADSFTFKANDGTEDSNLATVSLQVLAVNDAPVAADAMVQTTEDTPKSFTLSATDVENDALTFAVVAPPKNGTLSGNAPNLTYTPNLNFSGSDAFTFKANDGKADSNVATITLQVLAANDAPVANSQSVTTDEDTSTAIILTASDSENDTLSFSIVSGPTHGTLSGVAPNLTYTPNPNFVGSDSFTFKASDGTSDSNIATVTLQVLAVNDAPLADSQKLRASNTKSLSITLSASDADGDALTYVVGENLPNDNSESGKGFGPIYGTLSGTAPNLIYTAPKGYIGRDVFTFYVSDGKTTSQQARIEILVDGTRSVSAGNDSYDFILGPPNQEQKAGITLLSTGVFHVVAPGVLANDFTGGKATPKLASAPKHGRLRLNLDGSFDYQPSSGFAGVDEFAYSVSDGQTSATAKVRLNVLDRRAPELRFDTPANGSVISTLTVIRGRVRDRESGLKSLTLLWRRFDGQFWNGSAWSSSLTELPLSVQGIGWQYQGALPAVGDDPNTDLLNGNYDLRVTAMDQSGNSSRLTTLITFDSDVAASEFSSVHLSSASASAVLNGLALRFTGALAVDSARDAMNYAVSINGVAAEIGAANYDSNIVVLDGFDLQEGDEIELRIEGLRDTNGKVLKGGTIHLIAR